VIAKPEIETFLSISGVKLKRNAENFNLASWNGAKNADHSLIGE
jgi:hypothetical protein